MFVLTQLFGWIIYDAIDISQTKSRGEKEKNTKQRKRENKSMVVVTQR